MVVRTFGFTYERRSYIAFWSGTEGQTVVSRLAENMLRSSSYSMDPLQLVEGKMMIPERKCWHTPLTGWCMHEVLGHDPCHDLPEVCLSCDEM